MIFSNPAASTTQLLTQTYKRAATVAIADRSIATAEFF